MRAQEKASRQEMEPELELQSAVERRLEAIYTHSNCLGEEERGREWLAVEPFTKTSNTEGILGVERKNR